MKLTIDYDLFKDKLNVLGSEFFEVTDRKQALPILSIHQILKECEVGEWIPITFRDVDDEEYKEIIRRHDYIPREECKVYECRMPDDGQEVLVTTCGGEVCEDIFCADPDYYGFENCSDPGDAIAWMPKPEAYKKEDTK